MDKVKEFIASSGAKGVLLVSGSRSLEGEQVYSKRAVLLAKDRQWAIFSGDAMGIDYEIVTWAAAYRVPTVIFGCSAVDSLVIRNPIRGWLARTGHDRRDTGWDYLTYLVDGGSPRGSAFIIRDKFMAEVAATYEHNGFIGIWNGYSKGTIQTANAAKALNIPGIIYNVSDNTREKWEKR